MEVKYLVGGLLVGGAVGIAVVMLLALVFGKKSGKKFGAESHQFGNTLKKGVKDFASSLKNRYTAKIDQMSEMSSTIKIRECNI